MIRFPLQTAQLFFSAPRLQAYLDEAQDYDQALDLYMWGSEVAGAFHATLSFLEIALRNAVDHQLKEWNGKESSQVWTTRGDTRDELRAVAGKAIGAARKHAKKELERKGQSPDVQPTHDQILAQFTFGNLSYLFIDPGYQDGGSKKADRDTLWDEALKLAFPDEGQPIGKRVCNYQNGRMRIGRQLEHLRQLRNRVAHHDNLLHVDIRKEIHTINSVLSKMNTELPAVAMSKSQLRRLRREDPRVQP